MTALEIRLIAYGALVLALMGLGGWSGYRLTRNHYEAVIQADRAAQQQALTDAQQKVISAQNAQAAATQQAEQQYASLKASYDSLGTRLADSVRELTQIHSLVLSSGSGSTAEPHAAGQGSGGDTELAGAAGEAASACLTDAAELTALQIWARSISQEKVP